MAEDGKTVFLTAIKQFEDAASASRDYDALDHLDAIHFRYRALKLDARYELLLAIGTEFFNLSKEHASQEPVLHALRFFRVVLEATDDLTPS
jgi:hypothetical protein